MLTRKRCYPKESENISGVDSQTVRIPRDKTHRRRILCSRVREIRPISELHSAVFHYTLWCLLNFTYQESLIKYGSLVVYLFNINSFLYLYGQKVFYEKLVHFLKIMRKIMSDHKMLKFRFIQLFEWKFWKIMSLPVNNSGRKMRDEKILKYFSWNKKIQSNIVIRNSSNSLKFAYHHPYWTTRTFRNYNKVFFSFHSTSQ